MKDIPLFTSEYGAASLTLCQIPYRKEAYIRIQSSRQPLRLVAECISFCRACGAEKIYATGDSELESFPFHTSIVQMSCQRAALPDTDAALWPVQAETLSRWREIYNERMGSVANAAYMTEGDGEAMLCSGDGYFVHRETVLLGIGRASGERMDAVVSCRKGAGEDVVLALAHATASERIILEVSSVNHRAVALYKRLQFIPTAEISRWYQVF